ncbi:hypothetical protein [Aquimarina rhabdastrellae]
MKKILNLKGIKTLNRDEQQQIKGAWGRVSCCPSGRGCLLGYYNGEPFCEPGYCDRRRGTCIIY